MDVDCLNYNAAGSILLLFLQHRKYDLYHPDNKVKELLQELSVKYIRD